MVFLFLPVDATAFESPANRKQSKTARSLTVEAVKLIDQGKWEEGRQKIAQSKDPFAAKIFYWLQLTKGEQKEWSNESFIRLSAFIRDNPNWPNRSKMIARAEGVMPEELSNAEVIVWYDSLPPRTPYGMERYMDALIIEGKHDQAKKFLAKWWASTLISKDRQREIFKKYGGYLTIDAHKKRFEELLQKGHHDNAIAIANVLGQGYPALAKARIALSTNQKSNVTALINAVPVYLQDNPGLLYDRLHWRRTRNMDDGATEILLMNLPKDAILNRQDWWKERHIIIRRLLEKRRYSSAYKVAEKHIQTEGFPHAQAQWITGWLALHYMNKPTEAYERFSALYPKVKTPVSKARASYWAGRAAQAMGQMGLARDWYKKASEFQTVYYGQMASSAVSKDINLPKNKIPKIRSSEYERFEENEFFQGFEVFKAANQSHNADRFLNAFLSNDETPKAYRFAAEKLAKHNDYYNAVKVAKKASYKGMFLTKQAYPTITKHLRDVHSAEWALIHALIRQESMFDFNAKSHAGALGLMQLMPATARHVSKKMNLQYNKGWLTENPKYNIHLGSYYIGSMIDRYNGSYPLAIAAYNAGPGRVDKWLEIYGDPRKGDVNMIDWIELIPIYETRNYVQRVLENTYIYRLRLKDIQSHPAQDLHIAFHSIP